MKNDFLDYRENYLAHYGVKGMKWGKKKSHLKFKNEGGNGIAYRVEWGGKDYRDPNFNAAGIRANKKGLRIYNTALGQKNYTDDKAFRKTLGPVTLNRAEDGYGLEVSFERKKKRVNKGKNVVKRLFNRG